MERCNESNKKYIRHAANEIAEKLCNLSDRKNDDIKWMVGKWINVKICKDCFQ